MCIGTCSPWPYQVNTQILHGERVVHRWRCMSLAWPDSVLRHAIVGVQCRGECAGCIVLEKGAPRRMRESGPLHHWGSAGAVTSLSCPSVFPSQTIHTVHAGYQKLSFKLTPMSLIFAVPNVCAYTIPRCSRWPYRMLSDRTNWEAAGSEGTFL
jgi:hypothetical protein